MLTVFPFASTQTELHNADSKGLPRLQGTQKHLSPRRGSMKPYYYNEIGDICSNPLPSMVTSSTSPSSPLKYRPLGIKFVESTPRSPKLSRRIQKSSLSPFAIKLNSSLTSKEVFVMENTANLYSIKLVGFNYSINRNAMNRIQKQVELKNFFDKCRYEFNNHKKYRYVLSLSGKPHQFLQDVPFSEKVVVVSVEAEFCGISDNLMDRSVESGAKALITQIEDKFITRTSNMNGIKPVDRLPAKTVTNFAEHLRTPKLTLNQLKIKLGQTAVKIDTELPKLFDIGMKKIRSRCSFSESEIHKLYAKYKMLIHLSIGKNPNHNIKSGISREIFIESHHGSPELNFVLGRIFDCIDQDCSGTISWDEYLSAMDVMCNGTYEQQIDLFFRVYDTDGNGNLSFEEVRNLCKLQLQNSDADNVIEELAQSFASLIFDITETQYDKEIPAEKIKFVLTRQTDKSLIEMFCSFNFMKI